MLQTCPHNLFQLLALALSVIYYRQLTSTAFRAFLPFLLFIYLSEKTLGTYHGGTGTRENVHYYYFISLVEVSFYGYFFFTCSRIHQARLFILIVSSINSGMYLTGLLFFTHDHLYYLGVLLVSAFLLVLITLCYLFHIYIFCEEILLLRDPVFWVGMGTTFFFTGCSVVICLHELILEQDIRLLGEPLNDIIPHFFAIILYLFISISIILCSKQKISH